MDLSGLSWKEVERIVYGGGKTFAKIAFDRVKNAKKAKSKMMQAFTTSIKKGETFDQLVERVRKITGMEANDAKRIARTEATRIESIAKDMAGREMQKRGKRIKKQWICTFQNSRDSHVWLHEDIVDFNDDFMAFGGPMRYPGDDSRVGPEEIINCKCYMRLLGGQ